MWVDMRRPEVRKSGWEDSGWRGCRTEAAGVSAQALTARHAAVLAGRLSAWPTSRTDKRALPATCFLLPFLPGLGGFAAGQGQCPLRASISDIGAARGIARMRSCWTHCCNGRLSRRARIQDLAGYRWGTEKFRMTRRMCRTSRHDLPGRGRRSHASRRAYCRAPSWFRPRPIGHVRMPGRHCRSRRHRRFGLCRSGPWGSACRICRHRCHGLGKSDLRQNSSRHG